MKQKIIVLTFVSLLAGILITCQKDETDKLPPINKEAELSAAQQWYNSRFSELTLKSGIEDSARRRSELKPDWATAKVHHNRRLKTVETELQSQGLSVSFVLPKNKQKFEETDDQRYVTTLLRLVLQTHRRTGRQTGFLMTIVPSVEYIEKTKFEPFKKMAYIGRDKKFDGVILFHHLDGTFSNGWKYSNGKITHSIRTNKQEEPVLSLKSTIMVEVLIEIWEEWCTCYTQPYQTYQNCVNCEWILVDWWYEWIEVNVDDEEFGDGDENSGNGGGGGTYNGNPTLKATLSAPGTITLMNSYNLHVNLSPNGSIASVEYYIRSNKISSCTGTSCNEPARKSGSWDIYAKVTPTGGGPPLISNAVRVTVQYPDVNTIISDGTVSGNMSSVWQQTKNAASSSGRQEFGFWIFANTNGSSIAYECGTTIPGTFVSGNTCVGTAASVAPGIPGETHSSSPVTGGKYAVAFFHTHTPMTYCASGARQTGPSGSDISYVNSQNIPGILYDYIAIGTYQDQNTGQFYSGIPAGHNINAAAQTYTFGPNRRISY